MSRKITREDLQSFGYDAPDLTIWLCPYTTLVDATRLLQPRQVPNSTVAHNVLFMDRVKPQTHNDGYSVDWSPSGEPPPQRFVAGTRFSHRVVMPERSMAVRGVP